MKSGCFWNDSALFERLSRVEHRGLVVCRSIAGRSSIGRRSVVDRSFLGHRWVVNRLSVNCLFVVGRDALRVFPAVTRLTVYRRLQSMMACMKPAPRVSLADSWLTVLRQHASWALGVASGNV